MLVRYKKSTTIFSHAWLDPVLPVEKKLGPKACEANQVQDDKLLF